ncbi:MAG: 4,5-DOPA-extradiol-dioxygenase [Bacteroidia bacterium]
MKRSEFLKTTFAGLVTMSSLSELRKLGEMFAKQDTKMPVYFVGHGNPMNALEQNDFTLNWQTIGKSIPKPKAVLCVSAHWETKGTFVTAMTKPKTIHDFGGFPKELREFQYPAPGSLEVAKETQSAIKTVKVGLDDDWGLDHGCWSVITHMFPKADVPVLQLSLDYTKSPQWHYELAKELSTLRSKGVLIIGSGNMVHNLGMVSWGMTNTGYDWANEANAKFKELILKEEHNKLAAYKDLGKAIEMSVPTPDHYLPLMYVLGLKEKNEQVSFFNDKTLMGSLSMTSVKISAA